MGAPVLLMPLMLLLQGGEIDFLTYLSAVDKAQRNMYEHSEVGQAELAKMGLKATEQPVVFPT